MFFGGVGVLDKEDSCLRCDSIIDDNCFPKSIDVEHLPRIELTANSPLDHSMTPYLIITVSLKYKDSSV